MAPFLGACVVGLTKFGARLFVAGCLFGDSGEVFFCDEMCDEMMEIRQKLRPSTLCHVVFASGSLRAKVRVTLPSRWQVEQHCHVWWSGFRVFKEPDTRRVLKQVPGYLFESYFAAEKCCYIAPRCVGVTVLTDKSPFCSAKWFCKGQTPLHGHRLRTPPTDKLTTSCRCCTTCP